MVIFYLNEKSSLPKTALLLKIRQTQLTVFEARVKGFSLHLIPKVAQQRKTLFQSQTQHGTTVLIQ